MKKGNHEWEEDERFKDGKIIMLSLEVDNVKRETRMICKKCGDIKYQEV